MKNLVEINPNRLGGSYVGKVDLLALEYQELGERGKGEAL
jgi:hypothetical protein